MSELWMFLRRLGRKNMEKTELQKEFETKFLNGRSVDELEATKDMWNFILKVEKSYGGCHKCYGKGYSTQTLGLSGADDFANEGFDIKPYPQIIFCTCDRGKQLEELIKLGKKVNAN